MSHHSAIPQVKDKESCAGCTSVYYRTQFSKWECKHTKIDIKSIPDCPCMTCLVKVTCIAGCKLFNDNNNKYQDIFYEFYKITKARRSD